MSRTPLLVSFAHRLNTIQGFGEQTPDTVRTTAQKSDPQGQIFQEEL